MVLKQCLKLAAVLCVLVLVGCSSSPQRSLVSVDGQSRNMAATPEVVFELLEQAQTQIDNASFGNAQGLLSRAQRMAPNEPRVYLLYGDYHRAMGSADSARAMYQRAVSLSSGNWRIQSQASERLQSLN